MLFCLYDDEKGKRQTFSSCTRFYRKSEIHYPKNIAHLRHTWIQTYEQEIYIHSTERFSFFFCDDLLIYNISQFGAPYRSMQGIRREKKRRGKQHLLMNPISFVRFLSRKTFSASILFPSYSGISREIKTSTPETRVSSMPKYFIQLKVQAWNLCYPDILKLASNPYAKSSLFNGSPLWAWASRRRGEFVPKDRGTSCT